MADYFDRLELELRAAVPRAAAYPHPHAQPDPRAAAYPHPHAQPDPRAAAYPHPHAQPDPHAGADRHADPDPHAGPTRAPTRARTPIDSGRRGGDRVPATSSSRSASP